MNRKVVQGQLDHSQIASRFCVAGNPGFRHFLVVVLFDETAPVPKSQKSGAKLRENRQKNASR
jgi:hypothetical protein